MFVVSGASSTALENPRETDGQAVNIPPPRGEVESSGDAGPIRVGALDAPVPQGRQLDWIITCIFEAHSRTVVLVDGAITRS
jgi:hypothetical protein